MLNENEILILDKKGKDVRESSKIKVTLLN